MTNFNAIFQTIRHMFCEGCFSIGSDYNLQSDPINVHPDNAMFHLAWSGVKSPKAINY